ncbi:DUF6079 family protein [Pontibacillus litoralis]|uniref:Virulence associated protein n=1 Tax=Pontibacillus litoralis JSM 072002 TaxID=1385512 RepID=A0A0A5HMK0_9BACI|nr:DUF6079 family protein [Pontibacillus litoralis]KGX84852.1 virulence associated protein [Pontibacillus litoralis JSM 072002]
MRYGDLLHFEPIESVVQLTDANEKESAYKLLDTYVISERMAEVLDELVIEQLQFNRPTDNKGMLIVGNYGTGKSHLMSVISTIAEVSGSSARMQNERVAIKAKEIEGKFKVIRTEIGSVQTSFRDIICGALEDGLEDIGVSYTFPESNEIRNNKESLMEMMSAFHEVYPDQGLLLVVDELLDYLRGRKEQELYLDLGFLRELGEICSKTKFRFIAGVQEMLFDNPKFQFVAEQLRRVRERFEQVRIIREDIAYVVSQRLLKKNDRQKALIREHLQQFTNLYDRLGEDLDQYVDLFPIHPAYLSTFESVTVAEKRVILKTLSNEMKKVMDNEVPTEEPGLISFDSYWPYIENDPSLKSNPDIKEVMAKTKILQDKVENAFTKPVYKPMAKRIVKALAVFRLTTDDIYAQLGLTPEELKDRLFLHVSLLDDDDAADFLKTTIESVLREIQKTVSYQYISANETNGQYYLDIKKDVAVDDLIEQKAEGLVDDQLDRYYFEVLKLATQVADTTYVTNYRIWLHELPWPERKVTRQGYIFFGAPNERSTAQPPRDFYIYLLQPFAPPKFKDEHKSDEVFFTLVDKDEKFMRALSLYAGAKEMAATSSSSTRNLYESKADKFLKQLSQWLRENLTTAFELTYKGKSDRVAEYGMFIPTGASVREVVDSVSSECLAQSFNEDYPDYPSFRSLQTPMSKESLPTYVQDAFKNINGANTRQGQAILNGLVLIDEKGKVNTRNSGYAKWVIGKLDQKAQGQVVNRSEFIDELYTSQGTEDIELTKEYKMEPELFTVVLAALVKNGDIVITVNGKSFDAMNFEQLLKLPQNDFINFSHIKKPSGLPMPAIRAIFDLLDIEHALLREQALELGIAEMNKKARSILEDTVRMMNDVKEGFPIWEDKILTPSEVEYAREKLNDFKGFLEGLQIYNTKAKMQNLKYSVDEIEKQKATYDRLQQLKELKEKSIDYTNKLNYLMTVQSQLPREHKWHDDLETVLSDLIYALKEGHTTVSHEKSLDKLKKEYIDLYLKLHNENRLNANEDNRKSALINDHRHKALKNLSEIDILPSQALSEWQQQINSLVTCWNLTKADLEQNPLCTNCRFRPKDEEYSMVSLSELDDDLDVILDNWTETLLTNLNDQRIKESITLLHDDEQQLINELIKSGSLSLPIDVRLIQVIKKLFQGIEKVEISINDLKDMLANGSPLTVGEVRDRFEIMLRKHAGDSKSDRVRIMLKQ